MMRTKLSLLIAVFIGSFFFTSCTTTEKEIHPDAQLRVSTNSCAFPAAGGMKTINVATSEEAWTAELTDKSHFVIETENNSIFITCPENTTDAALSSEIVITARNVTTSVTLAQNRYTEKEEAFAVSPVIDHYEFNYYGGVFTVTVTANCQWKASVEGSWCKMERIDELNAVRVTADRNDGDTNPTGKLTIVYGENNKEKVITFSQGKASDFLYSNLLGKWDVYADEWLLNGKDFMSGMASYTTCTFRENTVGESYTMRNLFIPYSSHTILFDEVARVIYLPLGYVIYNGVPDEDSSLSRKYYLSAISWTPNASQRFGTLRGDISEDMKTIKFDLYEGYGLGVSYKGEGGVPLFDARFPYISAEAGKFELRKAE